MEEVSNRVAPGKVMKDDGIKPPKQVDVWYSLLTAWHAIWGCHGRRVNLYGLPVLAPTAAMLVAQVPIGASRAPQYSNRLAR